VTPAATVDRRAGAGLAATGTGATFGAPDPPFAPATAPAAPTPRTPTARKAATPRFSLWLMLKVIAHISLVWCRDPQHLHGIDGGNRL
jgi:hypothetical protein